ncbi:MAG: bacillithiol transferase BstA [Acidobacteriia bacterium]|nr:bacillithiol transferase BstA [Terriglobia bacterium]
MASSASEKPDSIDRASVDLRYPIGQYSPPSTIGRAEREAWIAELETLPGKLRNAVEDLSDDQLDKPYRPGGWTVRQVVHHIADGHLNSYTRFRLALTEQTPTIKPFEETAWAELPDAKLGPIEPSLVLTDALHRRWVMLLRSLSDDDFKRSYRHPERAELTPLESTLGYFAWHSRHHVAQILSLRKREGW